MLARLGVGKLLLLLLTTFIPSFVVLSEISEELLPTDVSEVSTFHERYPLSLPHQSLSVDLAATDSMEK